MAAAKLKAVTPTTGEALRARVEGIVETMAAGMAWTSRGFANGGGDEESANVAEALGVPVALVWLGVGQIKVEDIDALVSWWPRKEGA